MKNTGGSSLEEILVRLRCIDKTATSRSVSDGEPIVLVKDQQFKSVVLDSVECSRYASRIDSILLRLTKLEEAMRELELKTQCCRS